MKTNNEILKEEFVDISWDENKLEHLQKTNKIIENYFPFVFDNVYLLECRERDNGGGFSQPILLTYLIDRTNKKGILFVEEELELSEPNEEGGLFYLYDNYSLFKTTYKYFLLHFSFWEDSIEKLKQKLNNKEILSNEYIKGIFSQEIKDDEIDDLIEDIVDEINRRFK